MRSERLQGRGKLVDFQLFYIFRASISKDPDHVLVKTTFRSSRPVSRHGKVMDGVVQWVLCCISGNKAAFDAVD